MTKLVQNKASESQPETRDVMSANPIIKPKTVNYFEVPAKMWKKIKKLFPKPPKRRGPGRPRAGNGAVLNGIWYVLWTGCQWKAVPKILFGVCSSTLHNRFQEWQRQGLFARIMRIMAKFYARQRGIGWRWQSIDSKSCPAPLGGTQTGKNPTDRGKKGSKIHLLVDEQGAPLAVHITGANEHDKWSADDLIVSIVVPRPSAAKCEQHFCADKGYDYEDVHQFVELQRYVVHIKHRRRRGELHIEECPIPGETQHPARRWVVERTLGWLNKRRSLRVRWCKKTENWLALVQFASAHVLFNLAIYG
jgi:putative transposase